MEITLECGPLNDTKEVLLKIPDDAKKIGIMHSGGLDSTILLALFLKYFPTVDFTIFTANKVGAPTFSANILRLLGIEKNHVIVDVPQGTYHARVVPNIMKNQLDLGNVDYFLTAVNSAPPDGTFNSNGFAAPDRKSPTDIPRSKCFAPFHPLLKYHILDLCFREGFEHLIPFTHTCTEQDDGYCGICWFCNERKWAFEMLGKEPNLGM